MSIFHDVPTPLSFANKKNKMELVKLVKDNLKDIIDGTAIATADGTGAVQKTKTKRAISTPSPFSPFFKFDSLISRWFHYVKNEDATL